ncbi:hypothetical protein JIN84_06390 [Luteolibacter yonseiensis]|uniref:Porin n=1 Tax=Luteolibacter yonseiensis TaxID=1144680 RepID=A0A934R366_9BACT|nr:hypothetical protein [Luteolibacter yonseiensis]MBK1815233.1 hypothetical protein [Luteolibacter yonseiensis]
MKSKTALLATAATLALFGAANGQTVIDITGSTAGRSTVHSQILSLLDANRTFAYYMVNGSTQGNAASADGVIYKGNLTVGGVPTAVIIRTFWAGSASGVDYVSNLTPLDNKLIATSVTGTIAGVQVFSGGALALAPASAETVAEFGFSDVKQSATTHQSSPLAEQTDMFVLPFRWVATADVGITNITDQMVRAHYTATGETKKSLFTGNPAHEGEFVYAFGRDADSGTRITALAETGAGSFASVSQWQPGTVTGTGADVAISAPVEVFNSGYASGGTLGNVLSGTGLNAIGYLGASDAATSIGNGAVGLNFNGVPFSVDNVKNGNYTFWSKYQAIRKQALSGASASLFASLKTALVAAPTAGNGSTVKLTEMRVTRQFDGADVLPK